ncbi:MAG: WcbI family polysaccharide biosynthesis putative acetyltransferase [Synechococcaceae cyanobacterium]|nr:WcbI family polysaccharide biosynthesis putative acetyltransferase [Synechococcaceae cyanobacterium]
MLALGDSDKHLAIQHALAGAALLADLTALGGDQPDWLSIHEEQCCRYGCIWIHELLQDGDSQVRVWLGHALRLLARLEQLHPQPLDWAPMLRANFQKAQASLIPTALDDMRIVLVGLSACPALLQGLQRALPLARFHICPSLAGATADDWARLRQRLATADLLISHQAPLGDRNNLDGQFSLSDQLPATARALILPAFQFNGHHPFIAEALEPEGRHQSLERTSPLGRYHDFLAMVAARQGLSAEQLLRPASAEQCALIRQLHSRSLQELEHRERGCEVTIAAWIEQRHRLQPVAHAIYQPSQACQEQLLRRVLSWMEASILSPPEPQAPAGPPCELSIPIHPWVCQALDLGAWASHGGQRRGAPLTIEQQLSESIRFYRDHPWIGLSNCSHPTYRAAQQCLAFAPIVTNPTTPPSPSPSSRQPSLAALINYHDDEQMLAWQLRSGCLDAYDRIYLWDGPYQSTHQLEFTADNPRFLGETSFGQQLLKDPRVIYRQGRWSDEGAKRIEAYEAIHEDLIVLHDTDEFFRIDQHLVERFWQTGHAVASHRTQNLYAGGLLGSDRHHRSESPATLPCKRIVFRRHAVAAAQHIDHLWLVGVSQQPADESQVYPQPIGETLHLTGCRSTQGQINKMRFYKALALSQSPPDPIITRLRELIESRELSAEEALLLYLQGDFGFTGSPYPDSGLSLQPHFPGCLPAEMLNQILAESHRPTTGDFKVLEGYPLALWFAPGSMPRRLRISSDTAHPFEIRSWLWFERLPAIQSLALQTRSDRIEVTLPADAALMGVQVQICIQSSGLALRALSLQIEDG